jgi:tRNA dimethylallyltransferase
VTSTTPSTSRERRPLVGIVGPTGIGKTGLAVALAREWPIEAVSVDSRQVYRRMDIGTGKPTPEERRALRHHLIDVAEPDEHYDAARFAREAARAIDDIRARGRWPVLVGGTGLYLRALTRGLAPLPPADRELRQALRAEAAARGPEALYARLVALDPDAAARLHPRDVVRVIRAIEIATLTGRPVGVVRRRPALAALALEPVVLIGLTMPRRALYGRLDRRVDRMLADGLAQEVEALLSAGFGTDLPSMQGIGYRHLVPVVRGSLPLAEAIRVMKRDTRRYAKRQWTWFAREPVGDWVTIDPEKPESAIDGVHRLFDSASVFG